MKVFWDRKSIVTFIPFIFLAILFWISTVLSEQSRHSKEIWIELLPPKGKIVISHHLVKANLSLTGEGYTLLLLPSFSKNKPLKIQLKKNERFLNKEVVLYYLREKIKSPTIQISDITLFNNEIITDDLIKKIVPIVFYGKLEFIKSYGIKNNPIFKDAQITITGAKSVVDTLKNWKTEFKEYKNIDSNIKEKVKLRKPYEHISLDTTETELEIQIEKYTTKKILVPVRIEGKYKTEFEPIPQDVEISFLVGLSKYEFMQKSDFTAMIYLNDNIELNERFPVLIVKKPLNVTIQFLNPDLIDIIPKTQYK